MVEGTLFFTTQTHFLFGFMVRAPLVPVSLRSQEVPVTSEDSKLCITHHCTWTQMGIQEDSSLPVIGPDMTGIQAEVMPIGVPFVLSARQSPIIMEVWLIGINGVRTLRSMAIIWIVSSFDTANSVVKASICSSLNDSRNDHSLASVSAQQHTRELDLHGTDDMELKALRLLRTNRKRVIMAPHPPGLHNMR